MTVNRSIQSLVKQGILRKLGQNQRNRRFAYDEYMKILTRDTTTRMG
jgi:hypothetical protein